MTKNKNKEKEKTQKKDSPENKDEKLDPKNDSDKKESAKQDKTQELKAQLDQEKDRVLRLSAEFENYKKRKQRELDDFKKFANETVFKQMLTVVDNLERAIVSSEDSDKIDGLSEGVKLTHKEMITLFETFGVKPVDAQDQPFDPNFHQAVTQVETNEHPENMVTNVLQKGYTLNDRLLRPAMVVVSKKAEAEKETEKNNEN